jgi:hypothetical protein
MYSAVALSFFGGITGASIGIVGGTIAGVFIYYDWVDCIETAADHLAICTD